jgi:uncharacterized protein
MANSEAGSHGIFNALRRFGVLLLRIPSWLLIGAVYVYRWTLSPIIGRNCRFEPSCSVYFIESVRKYGAIRGAFRGVMRVSRCHPWNPGGYDPP